MILSDLNYLEPVSENNRIVGGTLTLALTDNTLSLAGASAGPNGSKVDSVAAAKSFASGDEILNSIWTNAYVDRGIVTIASAEASASSTAKGANGLYSSDSYASSLYISSPHSKTSKDLGLSLSLSSSIDN